MTVPLPIHFFEQAERLVVATAAGRRRQADLRRAVSSAYYGVFHAVLAAAADEFVGRTKRASAEYRLLYRSVDHGAVRSLCLEALRSTPTSRYRDYLPVGRFDLNVLSFAAAFVELQQRRHRADYDPGPVLGKADAALSIVMARGAVTFFAAAPAEQRRRFLALLLFPPR